jgi:hypothetical protein
MASRMAVGENVSTRIRDTFGIASERIICNVEMVTDSKERVAMVSVLFSEPILSLAAKLRSEMKFSKAGAIIGDACRIGAYDSEMFGRTLTFLDKVLSSDCDQRTKELLAMFSLYNLMEVVSGIKYLKPENSDVTRPVYFVALRAFESALEAKGPAGLMGMLNEFGRRRDASWNAYYRKLRRPIANLAAVIVEETGTSKNNAVFQAKLHLRENGQLDGLAMSRNAYFLDAINRLDRTITIR